MLIGLGPRGVLTMLGFRKTTGSQDISWPTRKVLLDGFTKPHTVMSSEEAQRKKNLSVSKLSVGARAVCKHAGRSSEGFWGDPRGTEAVKNAHAEKLAVRIIDEAVWTNIHSLPNDTYIIESRIGAGYGIRWTIDGTFRGFLEPQVADGHAKGWKH